MEAATVCERGRAPPALRARRPWWRCAGRGCAAHPRDAACCRRSPTRAAAARCPHSRPAPPAAAWGPCAPPSPLRVCGRRPNPSPSRRSRGTRTSSRRPPRSTARRSGGGTGWRGAGREAASRTQRSNAAPALAADSPGRPRAAPGRSSKVGRGARGVQG
eukprot:scaffold51953_cov51-Phaeocystis_antarctica.AAC.1